MQRLPSIPRYEVIGVLAESGRSTLYRAVRKSFGREVAIKVLEQSRAFDSAAVARFRREARAAAALDHPNAVRLYDVGRLSDGRLFVVMERLGGRSLRQLLATGEPLYWERAIDIASQVADAVAEAHAVGLVHRHLEPGNVQVEPRRHRSDHTTVLNFGLGRLLWDGPRELAPPEPLLETARYMAPEVAQGTEADARSDVYSLGMLLFHMLSGRPAFDGACLLEILTAHVSHPAPELREVALSLHIPGVLGRFVTELMDKDPDLRPPTMDDVRDALESLKQPETVELPVDGAGGFFSRRVLNWFLND